MKIAESGTADHFHGKKSIFVLNCVQRVGRGNPLVLSAFRIGGQINIFFPAINPVLTHYLTNCRLALTFAMMLQSITAARQECKRAAVKAD